MELRLAILAGFSAEDAAKLRAALIGAGVGVKLVPKSDYALTAAAILAGKRADTPYTGAELKAPVVIFNALGEGLDAALAAVRESGVSAPLKAVITPTNLGWTMPKFCAELGKERAAIERFKRKR